MDELLRLGVGLGLTSTVADQDWTSSEAMRMVHIRTRGEVSIRLGPNIDPLVPAIGPSTMSASVCTDPARFELERERVLSTHWLIAGWSGQIPDTGDWLTFEGHGAVVVVTRQPDGSLAGFHNVCQHRGPAIVGPQTGCGVRRFTCRYHGWVYDTTGAVVGVPDRRRPHPLLVLATDL